MKADYKAYTQAIRDGVSARRVGEDYGLNPARDGRCDCPWCSGDRKRTLMLYPGNRGAYCFRCRRSEDVIGLVMTITGSTFAEAMEDLNARYGLGLPLGEHNPQAERKARSEVERARQAREARERLKGHLFDLWAEAMDATNREADATGKDVSETDGWAKEQDAWWQYVDFAKENK